MKKLLYIICTALLTAIFLPACTKQVDYFDYVSEQRKSVYIYEDDSLTFKIYFSDRESPYLCDGVKGEIVPICECFLTMESTPNAVSIDLLNDGGQMNYRAVTRSFYLSFSSQNVNEESISVALDIDGKTKQFEALNVLYDGVIDAPSALQCVREYDGKLFESLTEKGTFCGEIYIRLLYDDGCFYYVGVCDREGNITAFLVDGESGRIIATRNYN